MTTTDPDLDPQQLLDEVEPKIDGDYSDAEVFYEHGTWWLAADVGSGRRLWQVVDAETELGESYFDLEEVT